MKKLITIAGLAAALVSGQAQCFTLRQVVSNNLITCDPTPWSPIFGYTYKAGLPVNTRKISWNSPVPVKAQYVVYGYGYDNPGTPHQNEATQMVYILNQNIPATYGATISNRFSECDVAMWTDFNTSQLREFVMMLVLYNATTGVEITRGWMQWTR